MARRAERADLWLYEFKPPDKRRPVVVLTRDDAIAPLNSIVVAPVTPTRRGSPGEVAGGTAEGLKHESAVNLDAVQTVAKAQLVRYLGRVGAAKMRDVCRALAVATGCDST